MASLIQDLELVDVIVGDVAAFAGGQAVSASPTIAGTKYSVSLQVLPTGPVAPFTPFSGSGLSILSAVLVDAAEIAAGAPASIAEKFGNTWYGVSVALAKPAAT